MTTHTHGEPATVTAEAGQVLFDCAGVAVTFTVEAALVTADRLLEAAAHAQGQIMDQDRIARERRGPGFA